MSNYQVDYVRHPDLNNYLVESVEFQPVLITLDGTPVTTNISLSITQDAVRPGTDWVDPITLDGQIGFMVTGFAIGTWHVYARVVDSPETPVFRCGKFRVS